MLKKSLILIGGILIFTSCAHKKEGTLKLEREVASKLSNHSNEEILNELAHRLNSDGASRGSLSASFICGNNASIDVSTINLRNGDTQSLSIATGNWRNCNQTSELLNSKLGRGRSIRKGVIFAICGDNATLFKYLLSPTVGIKEVANVTTNNWSKCRELEKQTNENL